MAPLKASKILLVGATGNIGRHIVDQILAADPPFDEVAVFTSPDTAVSLAKQALLDGWKAKGLRILTGDINNDDNVAAAFSGFDTVISALGRNVLGRQVQLLTIAEKTESVKWFFPSEYGTDIEYGPQSATERPHQFKLAVRKHARENITRVKVTYVVTGPYPEFWVKAAKAAPEIGGFNVAEKKAYVVEDGEGKIGFTSMPDVGKFVVAALRHPEASIGKALKVQSFVTTPNAVLAEFEKQTGGEKWAVQKTPLVKLRELEQQAWASSPPNPLATAYTLRRIWAEGGTLYESTDNKALELGEGDLDTVEGIVRDAIKAS